MVHAWARVAQTDTAQWGMGTVLAGTAGAWLLVVALPLLVAGMCTVRRTFLHRRYVCRWPMPSSATPATVSPRSTPPRASVTSHSDRRIPMFDALAPVLLLIGVPTLVLLTVRRLNLRDCRHEPPADSPHTGGRTVGSEPPHGPADPHPPGSRRTRHTPPRGCGPSVADGGVSLSDTPCRDNHTTGPSRRSAGESGRNRG